jgi:hypothetical protein
VLEVVAGEDVVVASQDDPVVVGDGGVQSGEDWQDTSFEVTRLRIQRWADLSLRDGDYLELLDVVVSCHTAGVRLLLLLNVEGEELLPVQVGDYMGTIARELGHEVDFSFLNSSTSDATWFVVLTASHYAPSALHMLDHWLPAWFQDNAEVLESWVTQQRLQWEAVRKASADKITQQVWAAKNDPAVIVEIRDREQQSTTAYDNLETLRGRLLPLKVIAGEVPKDGNCGNSSVVRLLVGEPDFDSIDLDTSPTFLVKMREQRMVLGATWAGVKDTLSWQVLFNIFLLPHLKAREEDCLASAIKKLDSEPRMVAPAEPPPPLAPPAEPPPPLDDEEEIAEADSVFDGVPEDEEVAHAGAESDPLDGPVDEEGIVEADSVVDGLAVPGDEEVAHAGAESDAFDGPDHHLQNGDVTPTRRLGGPASSSPEPLHPPMVAPASASDDEQAAAFWHAFDEEPVPDIRAEKINVAKVLLAEAARLKQEADVARMKLASVADVNGSPAPKKKQTLLTSMFNITPPKKPDARNSLAQFRGSRGPVHPCSQTFTERERHLKQQEIHVRARHLQAEVERKEAASYHVRELARRSEDLLLHARAELASDSALVPYNC